MHAKSQQPLSTTHDALAMAFAGAHRARLRYVAEWRRWMAWDGRRWRRDTTLLAADLARAVCGREAAALRADEPPEIATRLVHRLARAATPAAVERLARSDRMLAAEPGQWDLDPDLLNTPAGIVDTLTGATRPHDPGTYMTRVTAIAPAAPGTPHPLWSAFLDRITGGDAELAFYLQRLAGYALTGHDSEHALFFAHGTGANGKSTFMATLARILGDYAAVASLDMLAAASPGRRAAERARLAGSRLVLVEDTGEGRTWPVARLQALTGGDPVLAGDARHGFATVTPGFKLLFAGAERPRFSRVDEALRRRLHLIPFAVTIPAAERDRDLALKLEAEYPAILRWAIDGALAWRRIGLNAPEAVRAAGEHHLAAEDTVAQWLEECGEHSPAAWSSSGALYASWKAWCRANGETAGGHKRFSQTLEARGFAPKRRHGGERGFAGIALRDAGAILAESLQAHADEAWQAMLPRLHAPAREDALENADDASPAFARGASGGCRAEAQPSLAQRVEAVAPKPDRAKADCSTASYGSPGRKGEGGLLHGELRLGKPEPRPKPENASPSVSAPGPTRGQGAAGGTPTASVPPTRHHASPGTGRGAKEDQPCDARSQPASSVEPVGWPTPCSDLFPSWPRRPHAAAASCPAWLTPSIAKLASGNRWCMVAPVNGPQRTR